MTTIFVPRGLRPVNELAADRPHGDRLRYLAGCKCVDCRQANNVYECHRRKARKNGDWNGFVSAGRARAHIQKLAKLYLGHKAISAVTDIPETTIRNIRLGRQVHLRAKSERRILDVTPDMRSDGALVSAKPIWRCVSRLVSAGYTKRRLANLLGYKSGEIKFGKQFITVRRAERFRKLHVRLTAESRVAWLDETDFAAMLDCLDCGKPFKSPHRRKIRHCKPCRERLGRAVGLENE
ncbi:MAG: hypothetical protein HOP00_03935 [Nitrospira sp.]|nr:hypothetical protein [Nitrospira sp.]